MPVFAYPPLIAGIIAFTLGALAFAKAPHSPINRTFGFMCFSTFNWQLCWFFSYFLHADFEKYLIVKIAFTSIAFLPFNLYHFVVRFLGLWEKKKRTVKTLYAVGACFLVVLWTTDYFVSGYHTFKWGIYGRATFLHPVFLLFVAFAVREFVQMLWVATHDKTASNFDRRKARSTWLAFVLFSCASVEFLINYGVDFYPIGVFFIIASFSVIFYTITRYRLIDIRLFAFRSVVLGAVYLLVLGIPFWIGARIERPLWFLPLLLMAVLATSGPFVYGYIRKGAEAILLRDQRRYQATLLQVSHGMTLVKDLNKLLRLIVHVVSRAIKVGHVSLFLLDKETNRYVLKAVRYKSAAVDGLSFDSEGPIIRYLFARRAPLVLEEVRLRLAQAREDKLSEFKAIEARMEELNVAVIVPSFIQDILLGFLVLGEKSGGQAYTQDDLSVFEVLANQSALAIENAIFYEETGKTLAEKLQEQRIWSIGKMGAGIGHQINNRFGALSANAELALLTYLPKLKNSASDSTSKELIGKIEEALHKVADNAKRGGEIAKTLTNFSRKSDEFKPVDIEDALRGALNLLSCKFKIEELNLELDLPAEKPKIHGNLSMLQDIFFNMLDNTHDAEVRKYDEIKDGKLKTDISYVPKTAIKARPNNSRWEIVIEDNGIGMTEEETKKLFIPFFTTKATSEKGTGLGISMMKHMIDAHKGTIKILSRYGEGTKIMLTIPIMKG